MKKRSLASAAALAIFSFGAHAQSSVNLYGTLDQYLGYMRSSSGKSAISLNDGAIMRSRFGLRGAEELGGGYKAVFQMENGFNADTGASADSSRLFDRQAWVGIEAPAGQFRVGRQNAVAFVNGSAYDYTAAATYGSVVEIFGIPTRFDNDISYISPRIANFQLEAHYALTGIAGENFNAQPIYQLGLDYTNGPVRVGYTGLIAKPAPSGPIQAKVQYHNLHGSYDYGSGKVYFTYVRSNNSTSSAASNNAVGILSNVAIPNNFFPGTNPDALRFYNVYQVSADYRISQAFRVGVLVGKIQDTTNSANDAYGANLGGFYSASKRTTLYAFANYLKNNGKAGFRFSGSGAPTPNLTGSDVNGQRLIGVQAGVLHLF